MNKYFLYSLFFISFVAVASDNEIYVSQASGNSSSVDLEQIAGSGNIIGGYFYLDHTGGSRTFNITQSSTLDNDYLKLISNGNNGTVCIIQNDANGTTTSC